MLVRSLPLKNTKGLACDILHTFATHAGLLLFLWCHRCRLLGTKWQYPWLCFCNLQTSIFNKEDKSCSKQVLFVYFLNFIPVDRACDAFSAQFSFKLRDWSSVVVVHLAGAGAGVDEEEDGDEDEKTDFIQRQQPTMFSSSHVFLRCC